MCVGLCLACAGWMQALKPNEMFLLQGVEAREREVVWNRNDNRVKFICLSKKATRVDHTIPPSPGTRIAVGQEPSTNANGATVIAIAGKDAASEV